MNNSNQSSHKSGIPTGTYLLNSVFIAIKDNGGCATNEQIEDSIIKQTNYLLTEFLLAEEDKKFFSLQCAKARSILKKCKIITNPNKGLWTVTEKYKHTDEINDAAVRYYFNHAPKILFKGFGEDTSYFENAPYFGTNLD